LQVGALKYRLTLLITAHRSNVESKTIRNMDFLVSGKNQYFSLLIYQKLYIYTNI